MGTRKATTRTRTKLTTSVADLGSVVRFYTNNFNAFSFSFVLDKTLKLIKTPVANPIVHSFSSSLFSNTFKVFHYNLVSIELGNNVFADVMICPSHKPLLSARKLLEKPFGSPCAFSLKFTTQEFELSFNLLDFGRIIKSAVRSDGKVIYSEVNAKNTFLRSVVDGINLFRECEQKEASSFFVNLEQTFFNVPREIFFVTIEDFERNLNSSFNCNKTQNIILERSGTGKVVSHTTIINDWFAFSSFNNSASLLNAINCQLTLQAPSFKSGIDKRMQFEIIPNLAFPSLINTKLKTTFINFKSSDYLGRCINFDWSCDDASHKDKEEKLVYKTIGGF